MLVSVVVPAYNEGLNIQTFMESLLNQETSRGEILEVLVVASGCTDGTCDKVRALAGDDPRVRLIVQEQRLGKAAALNAYIQERDPRADITLMCSSDIELLPGFLDEILACFADPKVGMCGGRPIPSNPRSTFMGHVVGFLWDLHHEVSLERPKLGEAIAIRAALLLPMVTVCSVDEAALESTVTNAGFRLHYAPRALLANRGPSVLREYMEQRRRIAAGHYWLRATSGYTVATFPVGRSLRRALRRLSLRRPFASACYVAAIAFEAVARAQGYRDFRRGQTHAIWKMAASTRAVRPQAAGEEALERVVQ
jgi:poly-beta-1,6-N-acetyl-D-glucosamine synthase